MDNGIDKWEHLDKWAEYTNSIFLNEHVKGAVVAIVDDIDSFGFYGGNMGDLKTAKELLSKLDIMRGDLKRYIKLKEKEENNENVNNREE